MTCHIDIISDMLHTVSASRVARNREVFRFCMDVFGLLIIFVV